MSAEVVSIFDRRNEVSTDQPADPEREKQRETQRRLNLLARRLAGLDQRQVNVVFSVVGKALDWYDAKGALE
jgi:hypothetical protein